MLEAMLNAIMSRGKSEPGFKTMIDALHPAVQCYKNCIAGGKSEAETLALVKKAAQDGAESTKGMEAVRGRAYYQANKGAGHLDPGAVTMSYQIEALMDYISEKL
jgi:dihydroxyacetone kinase-like protein